MTDTRYGQLGYPMAYNVLCTLSAGPKDNVEIARELHIPAIGATAFFGANDYLYMLESGGFVERVARYGWNITEYKLTEDGKTEIAERKFIKKE
jgi:DNA-binding HxlR family transcriptional regulator